MIKFELKRGRVVHLDVGIHVAYVVVDDQVHVTKLVFNSTNVVVNHVASRASIHKSALIFTIVYNKLKNDLRLPLTSQIKELGAILQKLIKFEPGNDSGSKNETNETKRDGLASLAMRMPSDLRSSGLGSVQRRLQTNRKRNLFSRKN